MLGRVSTMQEAGRRGAGLVGFQAHRCCGPGVRCQSTWAEEERVEGRREEQTGMQRKRLLEVMKERVVGGEEGWPATVQTGHTLTLETKCVRR